MKLTSFSAKEIIAQLPHKYPFIMIDQALDIEAGIRGKGIKSVPLGEWYFQGHFPTEPIVPGVLIIEGMGQLTALVDMALSLDKGDNKIENSGGAMGYLTKADIKFIKPVVPGNQILMSCELIKTYRSLKQWKVSAKVGRRDVATGIINVAEI